MTTWVRANQWKRQDPFPERHNRSGQLQQFLLLAHDHAFAALLVHLGRIEAKRVENRRRRPRFFGEFTAVGDGLSQLREDRLLERKHEGGSLARSEPLNRPRLGDATEQLEDRTPVRAVDVVGSTGRGVDEAVQELT
jgi:hypothetical protein